MASVAAPAVDPPYTALVTGGAQGIGAATVRKLASRGINILIADISPKGEQFAREVSEEFGIDAVYQHVDVRREEDIQQMIKAVVKRWGRLDYAANIAGIYQDGGELREDETKVPEELVDRTYEINQRGVWLCQRAEALQMASQEPRAVRFSPPPPKDIIMRGAIANVSSTVALRALGFPAYAPTKAAVLAITRNGAVIYGRHGIRVNSVAPGMTVTSTAVSIWPEEMQTSLEENDARTATQVPLKKNAWPEEVANVISFLLSAESSQVSGVNIEVDGGLANSGATF